MGITKTQFFVDVPIWESKFSAWGSTTARKRHFLLGFACILNYKPSEIIDFSLLSLTCEEKIESQNKLIAAICHGPWILISAGVTKNRKMTAFWSIEADVRNSGADYQHKVPVVIDGNFITSPHYNNNGDFMKAVVEYLENK